MEIKCIAKYLSVEGNYKTGRDSLCMTNNGLIIHYEQAENRQQIDISKCKPVKLFAVTQNIEIGDKVFGDDKDSLEDPGWGEFEDCTVTEKREKTFMLSTNLFMKNFLIIKKDGANGLASFETNQENCFKVLGEISPNATWVKDGDEIEVQNGKDLILLGWIYNQIIHQYKADLYYAKCSQCKTYH